jgi:hypothetical protein
LRDSANNPRFIETLPRRGYRFIGSVVNSGVPTADLRPLGKTQRAASLQESKSELPRAPRVASRGLLLLIQVGYLASYIAALHHWVWVRMLARFTFGPLRALTIASCIILWCAMGLPVHMYLGFALAFDYHLLGEKFRRIFPFLLFIDLFWSGMVFFLIPKIGLGFGFALFVAAVYSPFAQRALARMAYSNS